MNEQSIADISRRLDEAEAMGLAMALLISSLVEQLHVDRPSLLQAMTNHYDLLNTQEQIGDVPAETAAARREAMDRLMRAFCLG